MVYRLALLGIVALGLNSTAAYAGTLTVVSTNQLRNSDGSFRCCLFATQEGYPIEYKKATYRTSASITNAQGMCVFKDVPAGKYALSVLHDENDNEDMDNHQTGMPLEGFGASNDAQPGIAAPPSFADAVFTVTGEDQRVSLMIRYSQL